MSDCPNLEKCGFVKKHGASKSTAVNGFITMFCKSPKQDECKRKQYKAEHGTPPSDDMLPNGLMIKNK